MTYIVNIVVAGGSIWFRCPEEDVERYTKKLSDCMCGERTDLVIINAGRTQFRSTDVVAFSIVQDSNMDATRKQFMEKVISELSANEEWKGEGSG